MLVNASVFVPLTIFTMTSLTGLFCKSITRPVTRICADAWTASTIYNIMYRSRFILLYFFFGFLFQWYTKCAMT